MAGFKTGCAFERPGSLEGPPSWVGALKLLDLRQTFPRTEVNHEPMEILEPSGVKFGDLCEESVSDPIVGGAHVEPRQRIPVDHITDALAKDHGLDREHVAGDTPVQI